MSCSTPGNPSRYLIPCLMSGLVLDFLESGERTTITFSIAVRTDTAAKSKCQFYYHTWSCGSHWGSCNFIGYLCGLYFFLIFRDAIWLRSLWCACQTLSFQARLSLHLLLTCNQIWLSKVPQKSKEQAGDTFCEGRDTQKDMIIGLFPPFRYRFTSSLVLSICTETLV